MPQQTLRVSHDSNVSYLPLVYFLPEDLIVKCPTLRALPRKVRDVMYNESMMVVVNSDQFLDEIMDATALLVFPHFGSGGKKEHYTGYSPVWQLTYLLQLWAPLLEKEIGWGLQRLFMFPSSDEIPFFDPDYIKTIMGNIVKRGIAEEHLQPILDTVREIPCDEDFERWRTNVRIDFIRKWYHTRAEKIKLVPLEEGTAGDDEDYHTTIAVDPRDMTEVVASEDYCRRFKARLSATDREILEKREDGFTFVEIAETLGYKNHSGVVKRMQAIKDEFLKYESEQK
jgi:hypothetical protein